MGPWLVCSIVKLSNGGGKLQVFQDATPNNILILRSCDAIRALKESDTKSRFRRLRMMMVFLSDLMCFFGVRSWRSKPAEMQNDVNNGPPIHCSKEPCNVLLSRLSPKKSIATALLHLVRHVELPQHDLASVQRQAQEVGTQDYPETLEELSAEAWLCRCSQSS